MHNYQEFPNDVMWRFYPNPEHVYKVFGLWLTLSGVETKVPKLQKAGINIKKHVKQCV